MKGDGAHGRILPVNGHFGCTARARHLIATSRPLVAAVLLLLAACRVERQPPPMFELLTPQATGIAFRNELPEDTSFNIVNYLYYYNGGGVAVGDVNGDGRPDLYFSSNLDSNRLYLNKGNYRFEDVTARAGVAGPPGWKTGVTMADVNGDGHPDIYVSAVNFLTMHGHNVLYVNDGDGTFTDRTHEMGLDYDGYATQALFVDYDRDGDLDLYLQSHSTDSERSIGQAIRREQRNPRTGGRLYRQDHGHFTDVSAQAGIFASSEGFGLGVVASDFDGDGCPDLYVANDFQENDYLYHNNCNGTFSEIISTATRHTSRFSMGVDAADINDDLRPDLFVADMLPDREDILKTSANAESFNLFNLRLRAGYHPQYARNTLQLNRGGLRFSEIGYLAGVYATDWSWAALFADLDNDGRKDLFVTSGILRRPNDLDYINYVGNDAVQADLRKGGRAEVTALRHMPQVALPNHAFRNAGNLTFTDASARWGLTQSGFSNGAAYVDLNNSGALDLVVNNVNAPAAIYRNRARETNGNAYLRVELHGDGLNSAGIGAKLFVTQGGRTQLVEQMPTRGFLSSVDPRLHVGLGRDSVVDSVTVVWPDGRAQSLTRVKANRTLILSQRDATGRSTYGESGRAGRPATLFADVTDSITVPWRHVENAFNDFDREPLMPRQVSTEGPALAVGDVNGDGLDDLYAGGAKWQPGRLLLQQRDGSFIASAQPSIAADSIAEDVDAALFDADGDGDSDLVVVSGGNEFWGTAEQLRPRLYLNDGRGAFQRAPAALPELFENASCVAVGDFDRDGHPDLFIGGRVVSRQYGTAPASHLLRNDGHGRFTEVTAQLAPELAHAGMVTSAEWLDYDGDGRLDLTVVGEWMPVRLFRQGSDGRFAERTTAAGFGQSEGWWNRVVSADVNRDGRPDLVLGNLGLNSYITASADEPAELYVADFARSGSLEQVLTFFKHGVSYPIASRDELVRLVPALRSRFPSYREYGASRIEDIFPAAELAKATRLVARTFASAVAINDGDGTFTMRSLPTEAQFAPVEAVLAGDFDRDGVTDLLLGGNFYGVPPVQGRYDASYGTLLHGLGDGSFHALDPGTTGLALDGEVRRMVRLRSAAGDTLVVVARNDDRLQLLRPGRARAAPPVAKRVVAASPAH